MREKTISRSVENDEVNPLRVEKESKLIVDFAVPCVISMLVTSLYNIVDQIFIGQGVGMLGNAATNIAFPLSIACTAISLLLGIGAAFWGLVAGVLVRWFLHRPRTRPS